MIVAANWKMNLAPGEARSFAREFLPLVPEVGGRRIVFFPSAVSLGATVEAFAGRADIEVGAQDVHWEPKGAFTGATSIPLIQACGATCALVGHSERRHIFRETDEDTACKVTALLVAGLTPFLCVGELLTERESGNTERVVIRQLRAGCAGLSPEQVARMVIAYEPVWAIGTGKTATPKDASQVHATIRRELIRFGAPSVPILYGGSVNRENAGALMSEPGIDGVLVGGASLDPTSWAQIVSAAPQR